MSSDLKTLVPTKTVMAFINISCLVERMRYAVHLNSIRHIFIFIVKPVHGKGSGCLIAKDAVNVTHHTFRNFLSIDRQPQYLNN
jgi:hypothetical protein